MRSEPGPGADWSAAQIQTARGGPPTAKAMSSMSITRRARITLLLERICA